MEQPRVMRTGAGRSAGLDRLALDLPREAQTTQLTTENDPDEIRDANKDCKS